jgi:hypothetical protein
MEKLNDEQGGRTINRGSTTTNGGKPHQMWRSYNKDRRATMNGRASNKWGKLARKAG